MNIEGKVIAFLGDSITEGVGVSDIKNNRYDNVLCREHKLKAVYNYGIGGTRIAHQTKPSDKPRHDLCFCGRVYDVTKEADIVVVYGGVNDYLHGDAPIGEENDITPATFYGGVNFLMNFLKVNYEGKHVVFMTPARCKWSDYDHRIKSTNKAKRDDAQPLEYYVEIIKKAGKVHGVHVLDLYEKLGIDPIDDGQRRKYTSDGLHFNDAGHKILADRLAEFLSSI